MTKRKLGELVQQRIAVLWFTLDLAWKANSRVLVLHVAANLILALIPAELLHITNLLVEAVRKADGGLRPTLLVLGVQIGVLAFQYGLQTVDGLAAQLGQQMTANHVLALIARAAKRHPYDVRQSTAFNEDLSFLQANTPFRSYNVIDQTISLIGSCLTMASVLLEVGRANWLVSLVVLIATLPMLYAARRAARVQFQSSVGQVGDAYLGRYFYQVLVQRNHAAEISLHGAEEFLLRRWYTHANRALQIAWRALVGQTIVEIPAQVLNLLVLAGTTLVLAIFVSKNMISIGQFVADVQGVTLLQGRANGLYMAIAQLLQVELFTRRLKSFLEDVPAWSTEVAPNVVQCRNSVELRAVSYRYPNATVPTLKDIHVDIPSGTITALVGGNGAGKSTLLHLIGGLLPPSGGQVYRQTPDHSPGPWQSEVAIVTQGFGMFNLTLFENVALADAGDDVQAETDVADALRRAGAVDLLERVGLRTPLGPDANHGFELSRGQWQRVAIARALYRRPRLLLLDEPAASADSVQRQAVAELIRNLRGQTTVVVATHDAEVATRADQVLVMVDGAIVASGTHAELMDSSHQYRALFAQEPSLQIEPEVMAR